MTFQAASAGTYTFRLINEEANWKRIRVYRVNEVGDVLEITSRAARYQMPDLTRPEIPFQIGIALFITTFSCKVLVIFKNFSDFFVSGLDLCNTVRFNNNSSFNCSLSEIERLNLRFNDISSHNCRFFSFCVINYHYLFLC